MKITFIGSGNVANFFSSKINFTTHSVNQVHSRNRKTGEALAQFTKSTFIDDIENINMDSDIYIISVNDDEIIKVSNKLRTISKLVVHTSGSTPMESITACSKNIGVIYPLISITKNTSSVPVEFPVCVESNNNSSLKQCKKLARLFSNKLIEADSDTRAILHLSAVLVNNFGNHLYTLADTLLINNKLNLKLLEPIILQTAQRVQNEKPINLQTGPAIRNDKKIMKKHLQLIGDNKILSAIYKSFSKSIFESGK